MHLVERQKRHYNAECVNAGECLSMNYKLEKTEVPNIRRKIMSSVHAETGWKLRDNKEVYKNLEKISETMRNRRVISL